MTYIERIKTLAERAPTMLDHLQTEEATKNALVMPFIAALGYDVFNPLEVVPEFTADLATKKGEKVDYAIKRGEEIVILVEAKKAGEDLNDAHAGQLYRYFSVTNARISLLTNGLLYRFFSDLDEPNKMDAKPFLEIDLRNLKEDLLAELRKLTKDAFDLETMLATANDLKYLREIRRVLDAELKDPSEEFVRFFFARANPTGRFTQSAREQFTPLVSQAMKQFVADKVSDRLRAALERPTTKSDEEQVPPTEDNTGDEDGIVTTEEELEGYRVVKAIVCGVLDAERVVYRDTKSYFGVLCDNNNRKPICRLHFNRTQKYISLFDEAKSETRHAIGGIEGIYAFADEIRATAKRYAEQAPAEPVSGEVESGELARLQPEPAGRRGA